MRIHFNYDKKQVIQALRYHFISRPEIKVMIIVVNLFAVATLLLFLFHLIQPIAFLGASFLWILLMISFWFVYPYMVYRQTETFKHAFSMRFDTEGFTLEHENGSKGWPWTSLQTFLESPHFFHLYFNLRTFFLVPKNGCESKEQEIELRRLLQAQIPGKKKS